jgi:hypothetical protein
MPIINYSFQDPDWFTTPSGDPRGARNQIPPGWMLTVTPTGQPLTIPTKKSDCGTQTVAAVASGPPECVHKLESQLPADEKKGAARSLIISGDKVYKIFAGGGGNTFAATLSQTVDFPSGSKIKIGAWVLAETSDPVNPACGKLEDDHAWVILDFGTAHDKRNLTQMLAHHDLAGQGNTRAWNLLVCESTIPASGKETIALTVQQNWRGNVDFFIGMVTDTVITVNPTPGGTGEPTNTPAANDLNVLTNLVTARHEMQNVENEIDAAILAEVLRLRNRTNVS